MNRPLRVGHVITGLGTGGAENMLFKLLSGLDPRNFESHVISLTDIGPTGIRIQELGIPVRALGLSRRIPNPFGVMRLASWIRELNLDLVQTWMYHADLIGGIAAWIVGVPVIWNIRHSNLSTHGNKRTTIWTARACALLSRTIPKRIICCSEAGRNVHTSMGYEANRIIVIPNGFDLESFRPSVDARRKVRSELGLSTDTPLIGMLARFDPQKDHLTFIKAAQLLASQRSEVHFVLCGPGISWDNMCLAEPILSSGLQENFHLLGRRDDVAQITAALDIATLSSAYGEGFPNVIGEAMACEVPCVVTDVGDSALIVAETGRVVPPNDPVSLANAWNDLLSMPEKDRKRLGKAARKRVQELYSLPAIVRRYSDLYMCVSRVARGFVTEHSV